MGFDAGPNYTGGGKKLLTRRDRGPDEREADLSQELARANARIKELEAQAAVRPVTMRSMKAAISKLIGVELSGGSYSYGCTVSREDLIKIHAWIIAQGVKS